MKARTAVVAAHGHCFDGVASSTLFTRLLAALDGPLKARARTFRYLSLGYGPAMTTIPDAWFDGDDNAILDFRFGASARLTWYFDHHVTGFADATEEAAARARADRNELWLFFEPTYGSCTKLIADVAKSRFGVSWDDLAELIEWANLIDTARFASAEDAIRREHPILQLASVIEHYGDTAFLADIVPKLLERPVGDVAVSPQVQHAWAPLGALHDAFVARVRRESELRGAVAFVDLSASPLESAGKFVSYALHPTCIYSVMLSRGKRQLKVSVGYNPWCGRPRGHDIASICHRFGGGGHPAVGAFTLPGRQLKRAREAAEAIVRELNGETPRV